METMCFARDGSPGVEGGREGGREMFKIGI